MKVSVVIPVYNEEKYIKNCLDSLVVQTVAPGEIIVVDNNCTDKSIEIVKTYKNVVVVKEEIQGMIAARNRGFNCARYDIIAKTDGDTVLPENWVENIIKDFSTNPKVVGISMPLQMNDLAVSEKNNSLFYLWMFIPRLLLGFYPTLGPSYALRKIDWEAIKNNLCQDEKVTHEDIDICLHLRKRGIIFHDRSNFIKTSARRLVNNPTSFFGEYVIRFIKMIYSHRNLT